MPNRNLTEEELGKANSILKKIRKTILNHSGGDTELEFALRRKIYKELNYDERGKPAYRKTLKEKKRGSQKNICPVCKKTLPVKYAVLDRLKAKDGYTEKNTRLIHKSCDMKVQKSRDYR